MDGKFIRILEGLKDNIDELSDWEQNMVPDLLDRNPPSLSIKQEKMLMKLAAKHLQGYDEPEDDDQTEYDNCRLEYVQNEGNYVVDNDGNKYGGPLTKAEGAIVARWFNDVVHNVATPDQEDKGHPFDDEDDDVPFG